MDAAFPNLNRPEAGPPPEDENTWAGAGKLSQQIMADLMEGVVVVDRSFRCVVWNASVERLSGIPAENLVGQNSFRASSVLTSFLRETGVYSGMERALLGDLVTCPDTLYTTLVGDSVWLMGRCTPLRNAECGVVGVIATLHDITERKRTEGALHESEERFRMATQAGKMFAYEWDATTDAIVRSEGVTQILGQSEAEHTTGQHILSMIPPEDQERLAGAVARLSPEEPYLRISYRMVRTDGTVIWVDRNSRAHFDNGKMLRIVGMIVDVTERKRTEEALSDVNHRLIEAQEQERARIARELHDDFNQRLALLAIGLEQLKGDIPNQSTAARVRVEELREQVLRVSKDIQALSHELHSSKLDYLGVAIAMRSFCKEFSEQQRVKITFGSSNLPSFVPPDISLSLFRVLQEGLHNAAKHSGVKEFEVQLWGTLDEVHLVVSDFGVGFERDSVSEGQGLGLVSMRERVQLLKGTLSIESRTGRGTTIHACVPLGRESRSMSAAR